MKCTHVCTQTLGHAFFFRVLSAASNKLEGHDLAVAIRSLERLEQVERNVRVQPKLKAAKADRHHMPGTIVVTNPGVFVAYRWAQQPGFTGSFEEWISDLKRKHSESK